jgi:tetratricopeptide (TPR) repeat protein
MDKGTGRQRLRNIDGSPDNSNAQGFGSKTPKPQNRNGLFLILLIPFFAITGFHWFMNNIPVSPPTTEMPKPVLEMVKPTAEDELGVANKEKQLLKKVAKMPLNSPYLFGIYGSFALHCQGCGMYEKAQTYYDKAFALGPISYKTYEPEFAKTGDFQLNYLSMLNDTGRLQDASNFGGKLWKQESEVLGPLNPHTLSAGIEYARSCAYSSRPAEQQEVSKKLVALLEENGKSNSSDYVDAMTCLGESYQAQNQMHDAKICYEKALAIAEKDPNQSLMTSNLKESLRHFKSIK